MLLKLHHHEARLEGLAEGLLLPAPSWSVHDWCMGAGDDQGVLLRNPGPLIGSLHLRHRQQQVHAAAACHTKRQPDGLDAEMRQGRHRPL